MSDIDPEIVKHGTDLTVWLATIVAGLATLIAATWGWFFKRKINEYDRVRDSYASKSEMEKNIDTITKKIDHVEKSLTKQVDRVEGTFLRQHEERGKEHIALNKKIDDFLNEMR